MSILDDAVDHAIAQGWDTRRAGAGAEGPAKQLVPSRNSDEEPAARTIRDLLDATQKNSGSKWTVDRDGELRKVTGSPRLTKLLVLGACALTPWVGALAWNLWERVRVWPMKP